jgi:hypothetical protein
VFENSCKNAYPNIILHDCIIEKVMIENEIITFEFDDSGFWIGADNPQNPYQKILRTDKAEVKFTDCDLDFSSVRVFKQKRFIRKTIFTTANNISLYDFASLINSGKYRFEFVDEYYASRSAMFGGYLRTERKPYHVECQLEMRYTDMIYSWNRICEDRPW